MLARYEKRNDVLNEKIWLARWRNLKNDAHWHDEPEIIYCEKGTCMVQTETETICLKDSACVFLESGVIHRIQSEQDAIIITIMMDVTLCRKIFKNEHLKSSRLTQSPDIPAFYDKIKEELSQKKAHYLLVVESEILILLTEIYRREAVEPFPPHTENEKNYLLKEILKEIELHYSYIRFQDICKKFNYSPSHFSRLFVQLTATTFSKYLTLVKIEHAVELLQAGNIKKISEIASLCGFSSIRNFNRSFVQITGYTPKSLPPDYSLADCTTKVVNTPYDPTESTSSLMDHIQEDSD